MHAVVFDVVNHEAFFTSVENLVDEEFKLTILATVLLCILKLSLVELDQLLDL